jgi:CheY-like chemotaxis protein
MKKVLIADDEQDILDILQFNLEAEGYNVETANNGVIAIEKAKAFQPDLIILDVMMPGKTGIEVCSALRLLPAFKSTLIIFLTAMSDDTAEVKGLEIHVEDPEGTAVAAPTNTVFAGQGNRFLVWPNFGRWNVAILETRYEGIPKLSF